MSNRREFDAILNYSSFTLINLFDRERKKCLALKTERIKSKGNAVWRNKSVCKVGIDDNKNTALFLGKKQTKPNNFCHLSCKKKCVKTAFILKKRVYSKRSCLCCAPMWRNVLTQCNGTDSFTGFYLEPPILRVTERALLISALDLDNPSGFLPWSTA